MGELLGLGLSHYPGPLVPAEYWPRHLRTQVERGRVALEDYEDRARWPAPMLAEWGDDEGQAAARAHSDRLAAGFRRLRQSLDAFAPDLVLIWGDDQYENFRKDCIPPFCVFIMEEATCHPLEGGERGAFRTNENVWGLPPETEIRVRCHRQAANELTRALLAQDFDVSYAYQTRHPRGLAHSVANTIMYLDYDQRGFDYPILPFHVNCYGNQLMTTSANTVGEGIGELSPPSPSPRRCFQLGRAVGRFLADSPWRAALVASSSWSHGSLTPKHKRMYPDVEADRALYEQLVGGRLAEWERIGIEQIEDSGQHEFLNWVCLAGAMTEVGQTPSYTEFLEAYIFNSTKAFAIFPPGPIAATDSAAVGAGTSA
jgi:hypothetical protein